MKKIAFVDNTLWGLLNFRGDVIRALYNEGNKITLIAPFDPNISLKEYQGIEYISIKLSRKGKNPFQEIKYLFSLYKIYKKNKFDLVFHYTIKPNIYGNIAAKLNKIKSISIIPGLGYLFIKESITTKIAERLYKFALSFSKEVWFLNNDDKELFIKRKLVDEEKVKILPGEGINLEKFCPIKNNRQDNKIIFLMVARVLWEKGFKEYIEAAEFIKKKYNNLEFQLLGMIDEGNPSGVKKEIVESYHKRGIINYLGTSNNVKEIIANCDCIILPSYREGTSRVLLEGASMEIPLITTNVTGCKEIVIDGYNGYLCEVKNSQSLIEKIKKFVLLSKEEKEKLGKNGRKKIKKEFDVNIIIEKYLKLLKG